MNKKYFIYGILTAVLLCGSASAKVTFLPASSSGGGVAGSGGAFNPKTQCARLGYTLTSCEAPKDKTDFCSYSSVYFKSCKCPEKYAYTTAQCAAQGKTPSSSSCDGLYFCI